jgi:hypothetical protein
LTGKANVNSKKANEVSENNTNTENFDFYAQHFARPIEKIAMDAIQDLIEQGVMLQKKGSSKKSVVETSGMMV